MDQDSCIYVAGHRGLVGSAVVRALKYRGYTNVVTATRQEVDLTDPVAVKWWFSIKRPQYVFLCAAKVGGIKANEADPLGFFLENMAIERNVICNAAEYNVAKLLFLGSSCIYPKFAEQPIKESALLTGPLEHTTEAYALAKIAGVKLCEWYNVKQGKTFISAMPCNLYGPGDNYDPVTAHVVPGLIHRLHRARVNCDKVFKVWGDGTARREFLYSDDVADGLLHIMDKYVDSKPINIGSGYDVSIARVAEQVASAVGYDGALEFDETQPVGTPRKLMDNSKLAALGWAPKTVMFDGLRKTYHAFMHA